MAYIVRFCLWSARDASSTDQTFTPQGSQLPLLSAGGVGHCHDFSALAQFGPTCTISSRNLRAAATAAAREGVSLLHLRQFNASKGVRSTILRWSGVVYPFTPQLWQNTIQVIQVQLDTRFTAYRAILRNKTKQHTPTSTKLDCRPQVFGVTLGTSQDRSRRFESPG